MEVEDANDFFHRDVERINDEMAKRGIFSSGIREKEIGRTRIVHGRTVEKICLRYGKKYPPAEMSFLDKNYG